MGIVQGFLKFYPKNSTVFSSVLNLSRNVYPLIVTLFRQKAHLIMVQ